MKDRWNTNVAIFFRERELQRALGRIGLIIQSNHPAIQNDELSNCPTTKYISKEPCHTPQVGVGGREKKLLAE